MTSPAEVLNSEITTVNLYDFDMDFDLQAEIEKYKCAGFITEPSPILSMYWSDKIITHDLISIVSIMREGWPKTIEQSLQKITKIYEKLERRIKKLEISTDICQSTAAYKICVVVESFRIEDQK